MTQNAVITFLFSLLPSGSKKALVLRRYQTIKICALVNFGTLTHYFGLQKYINKCVNLRQNFSIEQSNTPNSILQSCQQKMSCLVRFSGN